MDAGCFRRFQQQKFNQNFCKKVVFFKKNNDSFWFWDALFDFLKRIFFTSLSQISKIWARSRVSSREKVRIHRFFAKKFFSKITICWVVFLNKHNVKLVLIRKMQNEKLLILNFQVLSVLDPRWSEQIFSFPANDWGGKLEREGGGKCGSSARSSSLFAYSDIEVLNFSSALVRRGFRASHFFCIFRSGRKVWGSNRVELIFLWKMLLWTVS